MASMTDSESGDGLDERLSPGRRVEWRRDRLFGHEHVSTYPLEKTGVESEQDALDRTVAERIADESAGGRPVEIRRSIIESIRERGEATIRLDGGDPVLLWPDMGLRLSETTQTINGLEVEKMRFEELAALDMAVELSDITEPEDRMQIVVQWIIDSDHGPEELFKQLLGELNDADVGVDYKKLETIIGRYSSDGAGSPGSGH